MTKTLLLLLILLLAFFMAFIPHIGYAYPLHVDEWSQLTYCRVAAETGHIAFEDPFISEYGGGRVPNAVSGKMHIFQMGDRFVLPDALNLSKLMISRTGGRCWI